jgi:hypothetical protein
MGVLTLPRLEQAPKLTKPRAVNLYESLRRTLRTTYRLSVAGLAE